MSDPLTIGGLVVAAIKIAAPEAVKAAVGEAVKGAYRSLTDRLLRSASAEVAMLEASPDSLDKQLAVAEIIDAQPDTDKDDLKVLAENLLAKLKERAPAIGLDIAGVENLQIELGKIDVQSGIGARIQDARDGSLKVGDISVGRKLGN
jgi:hypothetical protein